MISKVSHIGVCVSDLERSIRFYCDVLGFVRSETMSDVHVEGEPSDTLLKLRDVKLDAVYLERDGFRLELLHYERPRSPSRAPERSMNDLGFTHLSVQVPDVKAVLEKLDALGVAIDRETVIEFGGMTVAAFVRDPDGLGIELVIQH
ncbi:VOC family protein [Candidatus Binatia bacterium]|nr:VOC family protein [Candidatus Binatia bacterium]